MKCHALVLLVALAGNALAQPPIALRSVPSVGEMEQLLEAFENEGFEPDRQPEQRYALAMAYDAIAWIPRTTASDHAAANSARVQALKLWKGLVENDAYRDFGNLDEALFHYGHLLASARYQKEAHAVFDRLSRNHPTSPYVLLARAARADLTDRMVRESREFVRSRSPRK